MAAPFAFAHRIEFVAENSEALLRAVPGGPGILSLRGADPAAEPYLTRTADLRRRLRRLLAPPEAVNEDGTPVLSRRLNLRERVRWIEWTRTGSDFESSLALYCAARAAFGPEQARRRLRLFTPCFLRVTMQHQHPRVYATNRLSKHSLGESFGPFPSRAAAERSIDAVLDLFKLRRCHEELDVHPDHPGCAYGEMNKCIAPCKGACSADEYAAEASRVLAFFTTRGESMLAQIARQREAASEAMDFEAAAALHKQWEKARAAALLADELVRPVTQLRALIVQEGAPPDSGEKVEGAAVFLLHHGRITGPARLSTLGVRAVREQTAVGSSLFAQPLMLAPIPLAGGVPNASPDLDGGPDAAPGADAGADGGAPRLDTESAPSAETPEDRARRVIAALEATTPSEADINEICDYLSLFRRWYYRPEKQRQGEVFFPNPDGSWPIRRLLNGAARVVLGPPAEMQATDREAFKDLKTKVIHPGREGVERVVPVLPKRSRTRKAVTPTDVIG